MEITRLEINRSQAQELFSADQAEYAIMEESLVLAAMEGEELLAYALITGDVQRKGGRVLSFFNYGDNTEAARQLLSALEQVFSDNGLTQVPCQFISNSRYIKTLHDFFTAEGYTPMVVNSHYLMYYFQDIAEMISEEMMRQMEPALRHIRSMDEVSQDALEEFKHKLEAAGKSSVFPLFARENTRFYVNNDGDITSYLSFMNINDKILSHYDCYRVGAGKSHRAVVAMAMDIFRHNCRVMDESAVLMLLLSDKELYKMIKNTFGEAERDRMVNEYIKLI